MIESTRIESTFRSVSKRTKHNSSRLQRKRPKFRRHASHTDLMQKCDIHGARNSPACHHVEHPGILWHEIHPRSANVANKHPTCFFSHTTSSFCALGHECVCVRGDGAGAGAGICHQLHLLLPTPPNTYTHSHTHNHHQFMHHPSLSPPHHW